jgi:alkanesulfonate monooxygenase SsuD/methylene tetrahydromethanopterin reductase-like flavin-dependent oxidoreductase (luciferase family)
MTEHSIYLSTSGGDYDETRSITQMAERLGYRAVWLMDNTAGWAGAPHETPLLEPWSAIAALAEATDRIVLGTLATPPGRRHPSILARQIATADRISGGRVELTMGAGDEPQMYELMGQPLLPPGKRITQMIEEVEIMQSLWSQSRTTHAGEFYELTEGICEPKPSRPIPTWIPLAWGNRRMPKVIARLADGFSVAPHLAPNAMVQTQIANVRAACEARGRDPESLRSNRLVGVTITDRPVDVTEARRELLRSAHPRTREVMDAAGQYWRDILHPQWPDHIPATYEFEDFYETSEFHCVGTPEQIAEQLQQGVTDLGIDEIVVWPFGMLRQWEPENSARQAELVEQYATEVIPLVEEIS